MFPNCKKICLVVILLTAVAKSVSAQRDLNELAFEVPKTLLKKDLPAAIKEAEKSPANDLYSLFWRLELYYRAANDEKYVTAVKQIVVAGDEKNRAAINERVLYALKDPIFQDIETLQIYLQKLDFNDDIYAKFVQICGQKRDECDIYEFDKWLARKMQEESETKNNTNYFYGLSPYWTWTMRRLDWRGKFGLDTAEILNQFVEDARKNPSDLDAALRYLRLFKTAQDINWLAENFVSEQAYDYYELGEHLSNQARYRQLEENERKRIYQIAALFLQKSLSLPFTEKDKKLIWQYKLRFASVPPVIKNHEKQLRFWTKTELAETFQNMGEAQNAQPIVEELMNLDTSDIISSKPSQLAGAVQAQSGARAVESKILRDQATRQDSYEYWWERIAYYRGREEKERIFDAYRQGVAAVPSDLSNENSREKRLFFIRWFADFAEDEYGYYGNSTNSDSWSDEEKQKLRLWTEAENLLRDEFEKTKLNVIYSYKLTEIIKQNRFEKLAGEILSRNPGLLVNGAKVDLIGLVYSFLKLETVPPETKGSVIEQILKIAENKEVEKAWWFCEPLKNLVIINDIPALPKLTPRVIRILEKNLKIAENKLTKSSDEDRYEQKSLKNKYIQVLFDAYLTANDSKSAEKLLLENFSVIYDSPLDRVILTAAKNGAFGDAVRLWKLKANLNRRDLENLSALARYPAIAESLREFYRQMKTAEPFSTVPEMALRKLENVSPGIEGK